jgi:hypothetical protein
MPTLIAQDNEFIRRGYLGHVFLLVADDQGSQ